jgi:hypothetical protein
MSDAISKMIDSEDESEIPISISEMNNLSNNLRHGVMSKLNKIGVNGLQKKSDNALNKLPPILE